MFRSDTIAKTNKIQFRSSFGNLCSLTINKYNLIPSDNIVFGISSVILRNTMFAFFKIRYE